MQPQGKWGIVMFRVLERFAYIFIIVSFAAYISSAQWRDLDAKGIKAAAILKIADMTEDYGNLDVSVRRIDEKSKGVFAVSGNTYGTRTVVGASGFRQNVVTNIYYEVDMDFWCAKQVETCANFRNVRLIGNNEIVPAL